MLYKHTDDIDIEASIDVLDLDEALGKVVNAIQYALTKQEHLPSALKTLGEDLLGLFITTHKSMRLLIGQEENFPLLASDAMSICREQVEKLYVLALIIEKPQRWINQYLRNHWRAMYERYLLDKEEFDLLERFQKFLDEGAPVMMDKMRHFPDKSKKRGYEIIVSKRAKKAVEFNFQHPNLKGKLWPPQQMAKGKFEEYFNFPTPWGAIKPISNPAIREFLYRWYKEYKYFSAYSHISMDKIYMERSYKNKNYYSSKRFISIRTKLVERAAVTSFTASASACTIVAQVLKQNYGSIVLLREFWELIAKTAMLSRLMWSAHAEILLP